MISFCTFMRTLCLWKKTSLLLRNALLRAPAWREGWGPRRGMQSPPAVGKSSSILTVFPRVANGNLGLRALALAVDGLDFDLIRHKGGGVRHNQEGVAHDLFLPGTPSPLRAPLDTVLNLGGIPVHPPKGLEGGKQKRSWSAKSTPLL